MNLARRSSLVRSGPRTWWRVGVGVAVALAGCALAVAFVRATGFAFQSLPFVLVILAATLIGRTIAGAFAVVASTLALDYFVLPPLHALDLRSGDELWAIAGFAAVMLAVAQLVVWLESVGEREQLETERSMLLVRAGDAVSAAPTADRALHEMAAALVPSFADRAIVHIARDDGRVERAAAVHAKGEDVEHAIAASPDPDVVSERDAAAVIRTGRAERYVSPGVGQVPAMAEADEHLRTAAGGRPGSSIVVPLTARGRTFAALSVARGRGRAAFTERDQSLIEEIAGRSALVVDNARLAELERRSAGLTAVLQELTAALSASVTAADVGRAVSEHGVRAVGASAAAFGVRMPDGTVELRESYGFEHADVKAHASFSIDAPVPLAEAMRTGRPVVLRTIEDRDRRFPALRGVPPLHDHALVCVPFVIRGSAIGGLAMSFPGPRSFAPWELAFMESIAAQAGQALDRAMLFESQRSATERLETSTDRLERLLMIAYRLSRAYDRTSAARAVVEGAVRATDAAACILLLVDETSDELVLETSTGVDRDALAFLGRVPLSSPIPSAEAARTGHPVWIASREEWPTAYAEGRRTVFEVGEELVAMAALPLVVGGRRLGAVTVLYEAEHPFGDEERDFLLTLAGLCAQSLQGALVLEEREMARAQAEEARDRIAFLAEATRVLSSSLDFEATISELATMCVPRIADWISVSLLDGSDVRSLVLRHSDPHKVELVHRLRSQVPFDPDAPFGLAKVVRERDSELIERVDDELLKAWIGDPDVLEAVRQLGLTSVATVPMIVQERVVGAVSVAHAESGRHYRHEDLTFLESLGRRAAVAIENARLFEDREHMARALQRSLLPRHLPSIPGVELAVRYIPFGHGHDVGGDFYDVFAGLHDSWGLLIGDVCGKGPEAASIVGLARHTVRGLAMAHSRPSSILEWLNRAILDESPWDRFCTACYVRLRAGERGFRATVALGGHLPPLLLTRQGEVRQVGHPGSLLGVLEQPELTDVVVDLAPGDLLLLYTDGLEEPIATPEERDGSVASILAASAGRSADEVADELLARFRGEGASPPRDDVAVLAVRIADAG